MALGTKPPLSQRTRWSSKAGAPDKEKHDARTGQPDPAPCPICQEPVGLSTPEGVTETWSRLPCGHLFGSYCIKLWLRTVREGGDGHERPACPICREPACHSCRHPVLPVDATLHNGWEWGSPAAAKADGDRRGVGGGKRGRALGKEQCIMMWQQECIDAQHTMCPFCIVADMILPHWDSTTQRRRRRRKKLLTLPWRFVRGCWCVMRHRTLPRRTAEDTSRAWRERNNFEKSWEMWWREQEPRGV